MRENIARGNIYSRGDLELESRSEATALNQRQDAASPIAAGVEVHCARRECAELQRLVDIDHLKNSPVYDNAELMALVSSPEKFASPPGKRAAKPEGEGDEVERVKAQMKLIKMKRTTDLKRVQPPASKTVPLQGGSAVAAATSGRGGQTYKSPSAHGLDTYRMGKLLEIFDMMDVGLRGPVEPSHKSNSNSNSNSNSICRYCRPQPSP